MRIKDIPSLPGGNLLTGHVREFAADTLGYFRRLAQEDGDLRRLRFFHFETVLVTGPAALHEILVEKARAFRRTVNVRTLLFPIVRQGLFLSDGEVWRRQRKLMAPLFSASHMESYSAGMSECIDRGLSTWRDGQVIDVGREATRITMSVVGKALFDVDTFHEADSLGGAFSEVISYIADVMMTPSAAMSAQLADALEQMEGRLPRALEGARASLLSTARMPLRLPTQKSRRVWSALNTIDERVHRMIDERRDKPIERRDLLSRLLAARDEEDGATMTDTQVRDEVMSLFFAGHETTTVAITWTLYLLSRHPDIYRRHKEEVDALGGRPITYKDLPRLPYTLQIFKEALRLYPPAYIIDREAAQEVEIQGYTLPRRTLVYFSPYTIHRRAELFPDPEAFNPDRFTPQAEAARPRLAYIPFGAGPRVCIGSHFALMEAQLILATITQRFTLEATSSEPIEPAPLATIRPKTPVLLEARARREERATA